MANNVLNFSWRLPGPIALHPDLSVGVVPSRVSAVLAAEIAERNGFDVLLVTEKGAPVGAFFRDYLLDILPTHHLVLSSGGVGQNMTLPEMIRTMDDRGVDFHSELVNLTPDLWKCPAGHITKGNPCPRHGTPTTPY